MPTPNLQYMAIGPYCWGRGSTREEAVKNARQNWPRTAYPSVKRPQDKHFSIYTSTGTIRVDGIGNITSDTKDLIKIQTSILATE